jgi:hypothetical protein
VHDYQRIIDEIHSLDLSLKNPFVLLQLGAALNRARSDLGGDYQALRNSLRCLRHNSDFREHITRDKDTRLMKFAEIKTCWQHHTQIPHLGWSICRQFSCLCPNGDETLLTNLFKTGTIRPNMRREQLDALRSLMRDDPIAPRH